MQSAAGSLRGAGPSKVAKSANGSFWAVGHDGLALSGHYKFRVVKGAVCLCGITLTTHTRSSAQNVNNESSEHGVDLIEPSPWYSVSSPVAPYPTFSSLHSHSPNGSIEIPEELHLYSSVIEVQSLDRPLNLAELAPPFKSLWHELQRIENSNLPSVDIPLSWFETLGNNASVERTFVVLGPKNAGKSSLAKYLCNRLYLQFGSPSNGRTAGRVFYLELDPGQPEYTPPGCVTLHEITEVSFSPAFAHADFRNAHRSHHLGYTSPMETPQRYLDMCNELFNTYKSISTPQDKLVVNTPGWTKGLGLDLNSEIVKMLDPLTASVLHLGPSQFDLDLVEVDKVGSNDEAGMSTITSSGFSSAELRLLQTTCYLHHARVDHLTTWSPFELTLGSSHAGIYAIGVLDSTGIDLEQDIKTCVEGALVSINVLDFENSCEALTPKLLSDYDANNVWSQSTCVGLAVIQYLSSDLQTVRILTPFNPTKDDLENRTVVLLRGRIQLPIWELQNRDFAESPWISTAKEPGIGATYTRFRRNIVRY